MRAIPVGRGVCGLIAATAVAFWVGSAGAAGPEEAAGEDPGSVAERLVDILYEAGTIDAQQRGELLERARREEARRVEVAVDRAVRAARQAADQRVEEAKLAPVGAGHGEPGPEDWSFQWRNGLRLERRDGAFEMKFGGRIQNDWAILDLDDELEDNIGGEGNGTELRRARLFFQGTAWERLFWKVQYDFANTGDGRTDLKDVYLGLSELGPVGAVRVGHFKEPFSLEEQTSSKYLTFLERSLPNVLSPGRNTGFMAANTARDRRLLWAVGVFKDANDQGFGFDDNALWNVTGRVVAVPVHDDEGRRVVHLGVSYGHQFRGSDFFARYRQRPEVHLARRFVDTGATIATRDIDLLAPELAVVWGPASLQAESLHAFVDGHEAPNRHLWGFYTELSYFLTGEHRNYRLGRGAFGRVEPHESFDPARGHWGAWQIAARISYLDLDGGADVEGGWLWDLTAGLNWYLYPNARILLNYVHAALADRTVLGPPLVQDVDGHADMVQVRFQVDF